MIGARGAWVAAAATALAACDPCSGTVSCTVTPQVSYSGRIIERQSGRPVAGVRFELIWQAGVSLAADTIRATSDDRGFFRLHSDAGAPGTVIADLRVIPAAPFGEYTVPELTLSATNRGGDGGLFGRLVVNPYLQLLGEFRSRADSMTLVGATVVMRPRNATKLVAQDSAVLTTDVNGRVLWEPAVLAFGALDLEIDVRPAGGGPASMFRIRRTVPLQYVDGDPAFVTSHVGHALRYTGLVSRRGTGAYVPGTAVDFVRASGASFAGAFDSIVMPISPSDGVFKITHDPPDTGTVVGSLRIRPPPPLLPETIPNVQLRVNGDDAFMFLGHLGYGPGATILGTFTLRSTGRPIAGVHVRPYRVGGLEVLAPASAGGVVDQLIRPLDPHGAFLHTFGTTDTGQVVIDIEVRLPWPMAWDTVRAITLPSRLSNVPTALAFLVGPP